MPAELERLVRKLRKEGRDKSSAYALANYILKKKDKKKLGRV